MTGDCLPLAKPPRSQRFQGLLIPILGSPFFLGALCVLAREQVPGCGRRPPYGVRIFRGRMLIFMKHTGVMKRLYLRGRVSSLKCRVSSEMDVRNEPNLPVADANSPRRHKDHRDSLSEFRSELFHVLLRALCVSVVDILAKRTQFAGRETNGKCFIKKELWWIRPGRRDGRTKPIPRRAVRVPGRIGFVSHNRLCRRVPAGVAPLRIGICL